MKSTLTAAALILLAASACKKDSASKSPIDGNWAFTSTSATTSSTVTVNDPGGDVERSVTTSSYTSTDNKGTISIGGGVMTSKGVSYTLSFDASYIYYINDVEQESGTTPYNIPVPAFNSAANFKLVGEDSIYFPNGGVSTFGVSGAAGGKYSLSGDILTVVMRVDSTFTDNSQGFPALHHDVATQSTILTKQ